MNCYGLASVFDRQFEVGITLPRAHAKHENALNKAPFGYPRFPVLVNVLYNIE